MVQKVFENIFLYMNVLLLADSSFQRYTFDCYYSFIIKVTCEEREALLQHIIRLICKNDNKFLP